MKSFLQYLKEDYDQTAKQDAEDSETISNRAKDPKIRKAWKGAAKKLKKTAVTGLDEEQLDELKMDHKTYVAAMKRATDYEADYAGDANRIDTDKLVSRAKKNKGEKFAKDLAGADQMTERPNRNKVSGQWGNDQLAWRKPSRSTKDGKANKTDLKSLKGSLTKGDYRKPRFKKRDLPESEQLDEVSAELAQRASDAAQNKSRKLSSKYMNWSNRTNKDKKFRGGIAKQEMKAIKQHIKFSDYAAKKSMKEETLNELHGKSKEAMKLIKKRIEKRHDDEWQATHDEREREKTKGPGNTERNKKRNDLAKRWLRADRAEKKLEEANSKSTVKIKRKYYTDKAKEMEAERHDRFSSSNPVRRAMMTQVHGSVGSDKAKKSAHKLKRIKQAADVAGKMLKK